METEELTQPETAEQTPAPPPPAAAPDQDPLVHVFSPPDKDGKQAKGQLPQSQLADALHNGYEHAVRVTSQEGKAGWMPASKVGAAVTSGGFTVGQPLPKSAGDTITTDSTGKKTFKPAGEPSKLGTAVREGALGVMGSVFPETQHPVRDMITAPFKPSPNEDVENDAVTEAAMHHMPLPIARIVSGAIHQSIDMAGKAKEAFQAGSPTAGVIRGLGAAVPVVGPAAVHAGEEIGEGLNLGTNKPVDIARVAHGGGSGAGLIAGLAAGTEKGQALTDTAIQTTAKPVIATAKAIAKVPDAVSSGVQTMRIARNPELAAAELPAEQLAIKATKPRNSINDINGKLAQALPDARRAADTLGLKVDSLDTAQKAVNQAKKDVWNEYQQRLEGNQSAEIDGNKVADAIEGTITKRFEQQNPAAAKAIREKADSYRRTMTMGEAEDFLQDANNELNSHYAKTKVNQRVAARDSATAHTVAEAGALRDQIYGKLDELTGPGAADIKQRYGALTTLEDVLQRRVNVAERAAPESLIEQMGKVDAAKQVGKGVFKIATGRPLAGAADIVGARQGLKAATAARTANDSNFLISKSFEKTTPRAAAEALPPREGPAESPVAIARGPEAAGPAPYRVGPGQVEPEQVGPENPSEKILAGGQGVVRRPTPLLPAAPAQAAESMPYRMGSNVIEPEYLEEPSPNVLANNQGVRVQPRQVMQLSGNGIARQRALPGIRLPAESDSTVMRSGVEVPNAPSASAAAEAVRARQASTLPRNIPSVSGGSPSIDIAPAKAVAPPAIRVNPDATARPSIFRPGTAPQGQVPRRLGSLGESLIKESEVKTGEAAKGAPVKVGTAAGAAADTANMKRAMDEVAPGKKFGDLSSAERGKVVQLAQRYKTEGK